MKLSELITAERVVCNSEVTSKKRTLEQLGELLAGAQTEVSAREVFDSLLGRERLGSTGLGHGVALPHGRSSKSRQAVGAFIRLSRPVNFDAIDMEPVDLVFALLVPEHYTDEHLKILAYLAEMFSDRDFCDQLRQSESDQALYDQLMHWQSGGIPQ